jgi:hypothetical protein
LQQGFIAQIRCAAARCKQAIMQGEWSRPSIQTGCCTSREHAESGAHAAFFSARFPDSHRRLAWLVGATEEDASFPLTDGGIICRKKIIRLRRKNRRSKHAWSDR